MKDLFRVDKRKAEIFEQIDKNNGEITEVEENMLASLDADKNNAILICKEYIDTENGFLKMAQEKATYFQGIANKIEHKIEKTKSDILKFMQRHGIEKATDGVEEVALVNNPPKVEIINPHDIDDKYKNMILEIEGSAYEKVIKLLTENDIPIVNIQTKINKSRIKKFRTSGVEISGTKIVQNQRLRIK